MHHVKALDGWRAISILAVLACHLLPLGPKSWQLNDAAGLFGMAVFFCLSGFLITSFLLERPDVRAFLVRRLCRILPLAWLAIPIALLCTHAPRNLYIPQLLFFANYPPFWLTPITAHFWSLCVEVQFYAAVALVVAALGRRGLYLLPVMCVAVTATRIATGNIASIVTYARADEIFAGATLALIYSTPHRRWLERIPTSLMLVIFAISTLYISGPLGYLRPYLAAAVVGSTLARAPRFLTIRPLAYIAEVSYALYVWHPLIADTWLGSGGTIVKYLKRPLLFAAVFATAHASTFWYEKRWIALGRRWAARRAPAMVAPG
jgi:peptidoglycan/LPS O-acetylase OafA/YrhL